MRENMGLYRGKKLKTSVFDATDWVYGSLIDSGNHEQVAIYPWFNGASTMSVRQLVYARMEGVEPETVGQFIGLTDKNGKMIFEGDIIETKGCRWVIGFENTAFAAMDGPSMQFAMFEQYIWDHKKREWAAPDYWEVVGNIHDNPELLEG